MKHAATHKTLFFHRTLPAWVALLLLPAVPLQAATQKDLPPKAKPVVTKPAPFVFTNPFAPKPPVTKPAPFVLQNPFAPKPPVTKTAAKAPVKSTKTTAKPPVAKKPVKPAVRPSITPVKIGSLPSASQKAKSKAYPMSEVSMNQWLLSQGNGGNSRVVVDISKQKVYLLINEKIALTSPISSARAGMSTPIGTFRMTERVRSGKISNLYHVGMPFWMRLGSTPYGTHAGFLPGYPASHGCIRLPYPVAETIFDHTRVGTQVSVMHSWSGAR